VLARALDRGGRVSDLAVMTARCAPDRRMRRVMARVSNPGDARDAVLGQQRAQPAESAPIGHTGDSARTTKPAHQGRADSKSTGLTPTLPISGAVMVMICPRYDGW